jgi:threonine/homoserine/homoserine lactone efflux protein
MSFTTFLLAATVLAITPGPGLAYVVARTVAGGRAEGLASCCGTALGGLLHVVAAALGLSLLIAQSAMAFNLLKYLGAAYLVYLGIRMLVRGQGVDAVTPAAALGSRRALLEGLVVEALNVKTALFFLAFLPQFVAPGPTMAVQLALLGCICVALNTLVDVAAVRGAAQWARPGAARLARARLLQRVSGGTMIGLGAFLALARRGN